jgi:hypothetical protein
MPTAGVGEFPDDIALAGFPEAVFHRMVGKLGGPEAEAIVVFTGQNEGLHAGILERAHNLIGLESGGKALRRV